MKLLNLLTADDPPSKRVSVSSVMFGNKSGNTPEFMASTARTSPIMFMVNTLI